MSSKKDNAYNINLLGDTINALQLEINILKEKYKLTEAHNTTLQFKVQNMIELCQEIINRYITDKTKSEPIQSLIKNSQEYL